MNTPRLRPTKIVLAAASTRPTRNAVLGRIGPRLAMTAVIAAGLLAACGGEEGPGLADRFASAISQRDVAKAAALTNDVEGTTAQLQQVLDGLNPLSVAVTDTGSASGGGTTLEYRWQLGDSAHPHEWTYSTIAKQVEADGKSLIDYEPGLLVADLPGAATVTYTPTQAEPPKIVDAGGVVIEEQQIVTVVNIIRAKSDGNTPLRAAALLATFDPDLTSTNISRMLEGSDAPALITLRASVIDPIKDALLEIPGVQLVDQTRLLAVDNTVASPLLGELEPLWQAKADQGVGWAVIATKPDGTTATLAGQQAPAQPDLTLSLELETQRRAQAAIADVEAPAMLVAIRPSDGALLAVAQNTTATEQGPLAVTGLYPPGSTFKTVTTAAALAAGTVKINDEIACPGTVTVGTRTIPNDDEFDLGRVPLHTAFARSCNTTMAELSQALPADALRNTALQFGVGVDYSIVGLNTVTGTVPVNGNDAMKVESAIGQGQVVASPFGMALTAATVAAGKTPVPYLLKGEPTPTPAELPAAPDPQVIADLRAMMTETVQSGTATALASIPGAMGKTGTAEFGDNSKAHGWFVGIVGDLAFAVLLTDAGSSGPAVDVARAFLTADQ